MSILKRINVFDLREVYIADQRKYCRSLYKPPMSPNSVEHRAERRGDVIVRFSTMRAEEGGDAR
jgi:hypothetical protein